MFTACYTRPQPKTICLAFIAYIATELLEPEIAAKQTDRIRKAIRNLEHLPLRHAHVHWEPWLSMGMRKLDGGHLPAVVPLVRE